MFVTQLIQDQQLVYNFSSWLQVLVVIKVVIVHAGHEEFQVVQFNTIYFYSGDTVGDMRCATVGIVDDTKVEDDEFFNFEIFNGWRTQVAESSTRINILENDGSQFLFK